ncbi:MAG: AAA family ATPase [Streptomycetales bacterium]
MSDTASPRTQALDCDRFVVITGGPGAGKTTLIEQLRRRGFSSSDEAGRAIIKNQVLIEGRALPWVDTDLFAEAILAWEIRSYRAAERDSARVVFFDRGVPDVAGYLRLLGQPVPAHIDAAARVFRYNQRVFIAPPWPAIYTPDEERKQTFDEATRTSEAMAAAYLDYGYDLVVLPMASVEDRVEFVLANR